MVEAQINVVIPLCQSKINFLDLRFALRSIEKFVPNLGEIFIVGEKPSWIKNINHIPFKEKMDDRWKERNIFKKIEFAFNNGVGENILFTNDDIILLEEVKAHYPYYHKGSLTNALDTNTGGYRATMAHTISELVRKGKEINNFDIHCPIVYNKEKFLETVGKLDWNINFGFGIKSMYCGLNDIQGEHMDDCKLRGRLTKEEVSEKVKGRSVISCTDAPMKYGLGEYLNEILPNKSIYE